MTDNLNIYPIPEPGQFYTVTYKKTWWQKIFGLNPREVEYVVLSGYSEPQPRDKNGRFVSKKDLMTEQLRKEVEQRKGAK